VYNGRVTIKQIFIVSIFCLCFAAVISFPIIKSYAQSAPPADVAARQAELQAQLDQVLKEIDAQQQILNDEQQKGQSYQRDLNILDAQIKEAQLKIRAKELAIQTLGKDINQKTQTINVLSNKIDESRESLAQLIRNTNAADSYTLVDVVLSNTDLSGFFADVDAYDSIKGSIQIALGGIKQSKTDTEAARQNLDHKRSQEIDAKVSIEEEKKKIQASEQEKAQLVSLSKAQQQNYQSEINKKKARAAAIRAALFSLRDTAAIPFGKALEFATLASQKTGVRPAFLLAILTQESNLGQNVGSCFLTDQTTGAGVKATTGELVANVMKPGRDIAPFLQITSAVGRDPTQTRVSCPLSSGYGGAMGPSQFIPSTWQLFAPEISTALGKPTPDPWEPKDAFMASALYLSDLGASSQGYSTERNAACRYYSGRACDSKRPANSFYGDQVMAKAASIQTTMIDPLQGL
jgi:peptidoglycan hydrolase CwlO-like protein